MESMRDINRVMEREIATVSYTHLDVYKRQRLSSAFNLNELQILENARIRHNNYFVNASNRQTKNRKYISQIITKGDIIGFYLETEYPVSNIQRIGNALRMYAIMAVDNGFGVYEANQRLMRAA